jgi:hypothetical protein
VAKNEPRDGRRRPHVRLNHVAGFPFASHYRTARLIYGRLLLRLSNRRFF